MTYNRTDAARAMLTEIEIWCANTGTPETAVGHKLFLHPGFVGLLRKRLTLSEEKEIAVRQFIYWEHPNGYHGELPVTHANGTRPAKPRTLKIALERGSLESPVTKLTDAEIEERRVDRDACPRCGVRHDIGCNHSRVPLGMVL